jgi:taurine transport system substrate-binding protein
VNLFESNELSRHLLVGMSRRHFLQSAVLTAGAAALAACGGSTSVSTSGRAKNVRATYYIEAQPYNFARGKKFYEAATGAEFSWIEVQSGSQVLAAFASGSADMAFGVGLPPTVRGVALRVPFHIAALTADGAISHTLIVRASQNITKPTDLVGKRIAVPGGTDAQMSLITWLGLKGIPLGQVHLLNLDPDPMLAAWKRGDIDAAEIWNPTWARLLADGGVEFQTHDDLRAAGWRLDNSVMVHNDFMAKYPDTVTDTLRALMHATDIQKADPGQSAQVLSQQMGLSLPDTETAMKAYLLDDLSNEATPEVLGTPGHSGRFADSMKSVSDKMANLKLIDVASPDLSVFQAVLAPQFLQAAVAHPWPASAAKP